MSAALPAPKPIVNAETQTFWDATREGRLVLPRCDSCDTVIWYPRRFCPSCGSNQITWFDASGHGTIYSFTEIAKGGGRYRDAGSYVLAFVELDEGPRVMTNIVGSPGDDLAVGQRVRVEFHPTEEGTALPRFRPV